MSDRSTGHFTRYSQQGVVASHFTERLSGVSVSDGLEWKKLDWESEETAFGSRLTKLPGSLSRDAHTMYDVRYFNQKVHAWMGTISTASSAVPYKREGRGDEGS